MVLIIVVASCKNDEEGSLTLHFKPRFESAPVEMFKTFDLIDEHDIRFTHLSMLVSDMELLTTGDPQFLQDVALVDLSFDDASSSEEGYTVTIEQLPAKTYTGLRFGVGVPGDQNSKTPSDFPSSNPLSKNGYYWQAWASYIFMKIEGGMDTANNGNFETNFSYHTGSNHLYRVFETIVPLTIREGQNTDLDIEFNYARILNDVGIQANPQNHNPEDSVQIIKIVNNLQSAITLVQ